MSPTEWEEFIQEWASSALKPVHGYTEVHRSGSAGDMGRDVVAYLNDSRVEYDNFQCKHYDHALHPSDAWIEIGKLCYWTFKGAYRLPRRYRFVAPKGVGTTLLRFFEDSTKLKEQFITSWDKHCASAIVSGTKVELTAELLAHINSIDFSIFGAEPPLTIVEGHSKTPFHTARFGGGLPPRADEGEPPEEIAEHESRYVRQLLDSYGEHAGCTVGCANDLQPLDSQYSAHLKHSREEFFSAECLNKFSRDYLPNGSFERLQDDVEDGVREVVQDDYEKTLIRVKKTISHAKMLPIEGHPLTGVIRPRDKAGICHQLANVDRIIWRSEEN